MATISFSPEAWTARTAGFPRLVSSILFEISLHNWRTGTSMSLAHYGIITSDLPPEQSNGIADMLCAAGAIQQDDYGIWSPAAIEEWRKAEDRRLAQSTGGRNGAGVRKPRQAPAQPVAPQPPAAAPIAPPAPAAPPEPPKEEDEEAVAKIERARAAREALEGNVKRLGEAWNAMALASGLPQIQKLSDKRKEHARARIKEHGIDAMLKAVESIPQSPFLMGSNDRKWAADFDFVLQSSSCLKLIEGRYHHEGEGKASGWR